MQLAGLDRGVGVQRVGNLVSLSLHMEGRYNFVSILIILSQLKAYPSITWLSITTVTS